MTGVAGRPIQLLGLLPKPASCRCQQNTAALPWTNLAASPSPVRRNRLGGQFFQLTLDDKALRGSPDTVILRLPAPQINHGKRHSATFQANTDVGHVGPLPNGGNDQHEPHPVFRAGPAVQIGNCLAISPAQSLATVDLCQATENRPFRSFSQRTGLPPGRGAAAGSFPKAGIFVSFEVRLASGDRGWPLRSKNEPGYRTAEFRACLGEDFRHDAGGVDAHQRLVPALVFVSQLLVVESDQVQDRGVNVAVCHGEFRDRGVA